MKTFHAQAVWKERDLLMMILYLLTAGWMGPALSYTAWMSPDGSYSCSFQRIALLDSKCCIPPRKARWLKIWDPIISPTRYSALWKARSRHLVLLSMKHTLLPKTHWLIAKLKCKQSWSLGLTQSNQDLSTRPKEVQGLVFPLSEKAIAALEKLSETNLVILVENI